MGLISFIAFLISVSAIILFAVLFLIFEIYVVVIGQLKGAPYVSSDRKKIELMLELAGIRPDELVVDLGSGDGSLVREAASRGARAVGIEVNPFLVYYSRWRIKRSGLAEKAQIIHGDLRRYPLQEADALFVYLLPKTLLKLKEKFIKELKPGARIISNGFPIPGWHPQLSKNGVFRYSVPKLDETSSSAKLPVLKKSADPKALTKTQLS